MQLTTWNVNSLRARADLVARYLDEVAPDVLALQETKCSDRRFPWSLFAEAGYEAAHLGAGSGAGVALASRTGLDRVQYGFGGDHGPPFDEPRLVAADCGGVRVVTVYVPNGRTARSAHWHYKLAWLELLRVELALELESTDSLLVIGDFNVCPTPADLYLPSKRDRNLVTAEERQAVAAIAELGLVDLARHHAPNAVDYTWFSFREGNFEANKGYRLDLALGTPAVRDRLTGCNTLPAWRRPEIGPSDHAPLVVELR